MEELSLYWDNVYKSKSCETLGWYEAYPEDSFNLIDQCNLTADAVMFIAGAGTTTLVDVLLEKGFGNILVGDISEAALQKLAERTANQVKTIQLDLTKNDQVKMIEGVDFWHDRAVMHFFNEEQQQVYYNRIQRSVVKGGYCLIAAFALNGAEKCSGLPVYRQSKEMIAKNLGNNFLLMDSFEKTYVNPGGHERPFVYTLFKRIC